MPHSRSVSRSPTPWRSSSCPDAELAPLRRNRPRPDCEADASTDSDTAAALQVCDRFPQGKPLTRRANHRLLEVAVALDRVCCLEEAGHQARLVRAFDADLSPRNLGIVGRWIDS